MGIAPSALVNPNSPIDATLYPSGKKPSKISFAQIWCKNEMLEVAFGLCMSREVGFGRLNLSINKTTSSAGREFSWPVLIC